MAEIYKCKDKVPELGAQAMVGWEGFSWQGLRWEKAIYAKQGGVIGWGPRSGVVWFDQPMYWVPLPEIKLSVEDQRNFADALANPPEISKPLQKAMERRQEMLGSEKQSGGVDAPSDNSRNGLTQEEVLRKELAEAKDEIGFLMEQLKISEDQLRNDGYTVQPGNHLYLGREFRALHHWDVPVYVNTKQQEEVVYHYCVKCWGSNANDHMLIDGLIYACPTTKNADILNRIRSRSMEETGYDHVTILSLTRL